MIFFPNFIADSEWNCVRICTLSVNCVSFDYAVLIYRNSGCGYFEAVDRFCFSSNAFIKVDANYRAIPTIIYQAFWHFSSNFGSVSLCVSYWAGFFFVIASF